VRFTDALGVLQRAPADAPPYEVRLVCGFTPLHLQTFLAAHLQRNRPEKRVKVSAGLYGDAVGTLEATREAPPQGIAIALELQDLDSRFGYRSAGRWGLPALASMVSAASAALNRLDSAVQNLPPGIPVAVCLPTLPAPPLFHAPGWQSAEAELGLQKQILEFASRLARRTGCSVVNAGRLAETSPPANRYELKSDLLTGLPYTLPHAAAVGEALALLLAPPAPKKGLITDLDDTLWNGLVGEIGPERVCWDWSGHHQLHGIYQKLLAALAEEGVLIGIASKNDPQVVQQALQRDDLLLKPRSVFPIEVHWEPKSGSVERILRTWNVSADSVVFIDDSPMELAEVAAAHPGIETILFPKNDHSQAYAMLRRLRDLFGKQRISGEDALRLESIRKGAVFQEAASGKAAEIFLQQAEAVLTVDFSLSTDPRALELVNKTNQFNLNGIRRTQADWNGLLASPGALLAVVAYEDRFGPLGKIGVIQGRQEGQCLHIDTWVMSCRAFSRRIEHQCLKMLFERYGAREIAFAFSPTPRNGPLRDFFASVIGYSPAAPFLLARADFEAACPPLYHQIIETSANSKPWTNLQSA
jgi:FkbH-like protein